MGAQPTGGLQGWDELWMQFPGHLAAARQQWGCYGDLTQGEGALQSPQLAPERPNLGTWWELVHLTSLEMGKKSNTKEQSPKHLSCWCSSPPSVPEPTKGPRNLPLSTGTSFTGFWSKESNLMEVHVSDILQSTWLRVAMVSPECSVPSSTRPLPSPPNSISASITLFHRANCLYIAPEEVNQRPVGE